MELIRKNNEFDNYLELLPSELQIEIFIRLDIPEISLLKDFFTILQSDQFWIQKTLYDFPGFDFRRTIYPEHPVPGWRYFNPIFEDVLGKKYFEFKPEEAYRIRRHLDSGELYEERIGPPVICPDCESNMDVRYILPRHWDESTFERAVCLTCSYKRILSIQ